MYLFRNDLSLSSTDRTRPNWSPKSSFWVNDEDDLLDETGEGYVATEATAKFLNRFDADAEPDWAPLARELNGRNSENLEAMRRHPVSQV